MVSSQARLALRIGSSVLLGFGPCCLRRKIESGCPVFGAAPIRAMLTDDAVIHRRLRDRCWRQARMGGLRDRSAPARPRTHAAPPTGRENRRPTREPRDLLSTEGVGRVRESKLRLSARRYPDVAAGDLAGLPAERQNDAGQNPPIVPRHRSVVASAYASGKFHSGAERATRLVEICGHARPPERIQIHFLNPFD
jgi:hypothetical protein